MFCIVGYNFMQLLFPLTFGIKQPLWLTECNSLAIKANLSQSLIDNHVCTAIISSHQHHIHSEVCHSLHFASLLLQLTLFISLLSSWLLLVSTATLLVMTSEALLWLAGVPGWLPPTEPGAEFAITIPATSPSGGGSMLCGRG